MSDFIYGLKKGIGIGISYLAVSFAFGVVAAKGMSPIVAAMLSFTNLTSSGQFAGTDLLIKSASYFEIGLTVLIINLRYLLMSISLSQKLDPSIPKWQRMIMAYGITDEIFAVSSLEERKISLSYMLGLMSLPVICWSIGTLIGAIGANILPYFIVNALGIALYAMFIGIVMPDAKKEKSVLFCCLIAILLSCIFTYIPYINNISVEFKIIIPTILACVITSLLFPIKEEIQ